MSQQPQDENTENDRREEDTENASADNRQETDFSNQGNVQAGQYFTMHPSDSDTVINKSDSDDGLFVTDSSDDVMNDVLSDFLPANERIEQTRETIMESLVQSFVSITPNTKNDFEEPNETTNEQKTTNETCEFDEVDNVSVQKDLQTLRYMGPMRRIPSDSAFPDFERNASDEYLASNAGSDEYVTVGSASEEPTTVSFFSQPASTSQLQVVSKQRSHVRSKSASSFPRKQATDKDESRPLSAQPASDVEHWLIDDGWLKSDDSDVKQADIAPDSEKATSSVGHVEDAGNDSATRPTSQLNTNNSSPQPAVESKPRGKNNSAAPTFKATKLPRFYRSKADQKMASSRSESCVLPTKEAVSIQGSVSARRSRSSYVRDSRSLMTRSTANEKHCKKDAGGVSYAVKHCPSPERASSKKVRGADKARPPVGSRSPVRGYSASSHGQVKPATLGANSKPACSTSGSQSSEVRVHDENKEKVAPPRTRSGSRSTRTGGTDTCDDVNKVLTNDEATSDDINWSSSVTSHSTKHALKIPQRARPGSPMKVLKLRSTTTGLKTAKSHSAHGAVRQSDDENVNLKRTASSSAKLLIKRPAPPQRNNPSSLPASSALAGARSGATSATADSTREADAEPGAGRRDPSDAPPAVMSLKVDVSVRAEDGSVHSFRDISPPRDGRTGDLFSGVEEFIRGLLEGPGAPSGTVAGAPGRALTTTPVSGFSPRSATPRSPEGGSGVTPAGRDAVPGVWTSATPSATPRRNSDVTGDLGGRRGLIGLDAYAQRLQAEESVLLTSTGSMSSTDAWPQGTRQIVFPSTTAAPGISATPNYPTPRQRSTAASSSRISTLNTRAEYECDNQDRMKFGWNKRCSSPVKTEPVGINATDRESDKCRGSVSPERPAPFAPPSSPTWLKSPSSSPERDREVSPRSRIPLPRRMFSEGAGHASRSPTPERHSFYHTAQTTPERPRSTTPNSLSSAGGSSGSLHSVTRSPRSAELRNFRTPSPARINSPAAAGSSSSRSHSSSPCSARSSPQRHNPSGNLRDSPQHLQRIKRDSPRASPNATFVCSRKNADGIRPWTKRLPGTGFQGPRGVKTTSGLRAVHESTTDVEPNTSSSGIHSQNASSAECSPVQQDDPGYTADTSAPTPAKRSTSGPFVSLPDGSVERPIPKKRTKNTSPVRPNTPHPQYEVDPMISSKTSFCSMDSPRRNRSPSPKRPLGSQAITENGGHGLNVQWPAGMERDLTQTSAQPEQMKGKAELRKFRTPSPVRVDSPAAVRSKSSSSRSRSASPRSARSSPLRHSPPDNLQHPAKEQYQHVDGDASLSLQTPSGLERELIETENTVRLMEETISVLERQNNSLVTNTRDISEKLDQERSRRCDLKTAKLMLQKVRIELQKTTKNSEENRIELKNANEKITEQDSAIFLLKESLREECITNARMEKCLRQRTSASQDFNLSQNMSQASGLDGTDRPVSSLLAEPSSVRELLEETETLLREERRARKEAEEKLAEEISRKHRIVNAAKKWREQLSEAGTKPIDLGRSKPSDWNSKAKTALGISESDSSNVKSYQSIHTTGNSHDSATNDPVKCKSDESMSSAQKFDIESVSGSEYLYPDVRDKQDCSCQCDILEGTSHWKEKYEEVKQINELYASKLNAVSLDRMDLKSQLQLVNCKLKEETKKKDRFEQELKNLIDRIHEMQRDVQLYQRQSKEQLAIATQGNHENIENIEMEKLKLKEYYQQQMETIVQEKVTEFQGKVGQLETVVRNQINTYTKSMQQKFREKLATASLQQKEVISRLEVEHSKEVESLTGEYPQEIDRLQQRLAEYRQEVIDKKNRLEQRETQVGTILRVVKLLIREGNAMKGDDTKEQNTLEIARKILRCMDLNLDDIASPRPRLADCKEPAGDREYVTRDGSCVTFRSIPDSPRPTPAHRSTQSKSAPPVPPRRRMASHNYEPDAALTQKKSDHSTTSQPFNVSRVTQGKLSYTRFGDEVLRARSEECLQKSSNANTKQLSTVSDLSQWGDSGSWTVDGAPPAAPPPTPPSVTTSTGTNTDEVDLLAKESAQDVASSVMKEMNQPTRVKAFTDKGTGSASSLIRDPSFLLLTNAVLAEDAVRMCQCKQLQRAMEAYGRLGMTAAHLKKLEEGSNGRARTRSSSETSIQRLASSYFEATRGGDVFETKQHGFSKMSVTKRTSSEHHAGKKQMDATATASRTSSESNQLFSKEVRKTLAARAVETGGKFANPFSMRPLSPHRANAASEKITSKPPIQNTSVSPGRSATGPSTSPVRQERSGECASGVTSSQPEVTRSRSRQDASGKTGFVERTISPSKNISSRVRKTSPTLKRMPSFDKVEMLESKESSDDSKFALARPPPQIELKPRDNRASTQRKQLAASRKPSPRERERHSISPRERKLFTLRNQQQAEKKITRTEVTKRSLSPAPVSPQPTFPPDVTSRQTRSFMPTFKPQRDRSRSGRRSATSSMDWRKYIKPGQPWQDVYLHEHNDPDYVEPIPTSNDMFYTPEERNDESDRSEWSPSYSWAPPRPGERDKWNRYLTTGKATEQMALERFYATPERESSEARRRLRRSRKQAEVLEHINRLLTVSSGSDAAAEERRRPERGARRARSHQRLARDAAWETPTDAEPGRGTVLEGVRRKALGHLGGGARHPADPLADLPAYPPPSDHGGHHQRVSLSLDRDLPMPRHDCSVHRRLSSDVKTHQRLAKEHGKYRRAGDARERSPSQLLWTGDGRRKTPLVLVSRSPRRDMLPPEPHRRRSRSRSRHGTAASALDDLDMDSWVNQWERKWDHERKQRPMSHWPPT